MEFHEFQEIISAVKKLKYLVENEEKQPEDEREVQSCFDEMGSSLETNVALRINFLKTNDEYEYNSPIKKLLFQTYFILAINKYKKEILKEMISAMQEEVKNDRESLFVRFAKLVDDINNITK